MPGGQRDIADAKRRLTSLNPAELNPYVRRLRWIAQRYPTPIVALTAAALAEATGYDGLAVHLRTLLNLARQAHRGNLNARAQLNEELGTQAFTASFVIQKLEDSGIPKHTRFDRYLPWVAKQLAAGVPGSLYENEVVRGFRALVDWAEAERIDLNRYAFEDALNTAVRWAHETEQAKSVPQGVVLHTFPDGWTVQELNEEDQLEGEAQVMQHCLDSYYVDPGYDDHKYEVPVVVTPEGAPVRIFSLRDPKGMPHVTMEYLQERDWTPGAPFVRQLRGKQNAAPKFEYLMKMVEFRKEKLDDFPVEMVDFPAHADGLRQTLLGAFQVMGALHEDPYLLYADGTVIQADDFEEYVSDIEAVADSEWPNDRPARSQYVVDTLDHVEPRELTPVDDVDWIYWAAWRAWEGAASRARPAFPGSTDEMVKWLTDYRSML